MKDGLKGHEGDITITTASTCNKNFQLLYVDKLYTRMCFIIEVDKTMLRNY